MQENGDYYIHTLVIGAARPSDFDEHMKSIEGYAAMMADPSKVLAIAEKLTAMYVEAVGAEVSYTISDMRALIL